MEFSIWMLQILFSFLLSPILISGLPYEAQTKYGKVNC